MGALPIPSHASDSLPRAATGFVPGLAAGATPPRFPAAELGVGSIFVVVALILLLTVLYVIEASEGVNREHRRTLITAIIPLFAVFVGIVLFSL